MSTFAEQTKPFPVPALLEGVGDMEGMLSTLRQVRLRVQQGKTPGIPTGLKTFDAKTGGLQKGVHLLAAAPGAGKTTLALQIARRAASAGVSVVYLAFDEGGDRLALKLATGAAGLSATNYLRGQADPDEVMQAMAAHRETLSRIRVYQGPAQILPESTGAMVREAMEIDGTDEGLLVVDYVQAWAARMDTTGDFRVAVTHLIGKLRQAAMQVGVPVLAIAAQNRSGQGEASMSSLRESSDLEYTADSICFLSTDKDEKDAYQEERRRVTFACLKNRWGATFSMPLVFDAALGVFGESR